MVSKFGQYFVKKTQHRLEGICVNVRRLGKQLLVPKSEDEVEMEHHSIYF